jgi:hypothetical protein
METLDRRTFLSRVSCTLAALTPTPRNTAARPFGLLADNPAPSHGGCWLDVCAPFIVEDAALGVHSEIILTSDSFSGARGYEDEANATEYELLLYDHAGRAVGAGGVARRLSVPAMRTTTLAVRNLIGGAANFWGGLRLRLRPRGRELTHASDLFSAAFVRWQTPASFDNVHANPDPPQWQNAESYYYSMPFPPLSHYDCALGLFNPYAEPSAGAITLHEPNGKQAVTSRYELKPHASLVFDLGAGKFADEPWTSGVAQLTSAKKLRHSGLLAVTNDAGRAKSFGYLMIRRPGGARFSVEHPIHQGVFAPQPAAAPFDGAGQLKAKNALYSPLLFRGHRAGNVTLESRCHFGTGLPLEAAQWLYPFAVNGAGEATWSAMKDAKLTDCLPAGQVERGVIRLAAAASCALDFRKLSLGRDFSGGLAVAVAPDTTHTLMKMEVRVEEWGAHAFTHFRPGLRAARAYQKPAPRGGLATDYVVSGARFVRSKGAVRCDELIGVINIDDAGTEAKPTVEVFSARGLIARLPLGAVPPFACRHYLLSDLMAGEARHESLSLRLVDARATLLMSAAHLDYERRDLALDHGSDRFSTFLDYGCR